MIINPQVLMFSLPSLIYLLSQRRRQVDVRESLANLGWRDCRWLDLEYGLAVAPIGLLVAAFTYQLAPPQALLAPGSAMAYYAGWEVSLNTMMFAILREGFLTALGEEVFFRGLLGGWLIRRLGFAIGNTLQALLFLVPHMLVLLIDQHLWPLLVAPLVLGWLFGWLRCRSGSILPGWLAHALVNALSFLLLQP